MDALEYANEVRTVRAGWKKAVKRDAAKRLVPFGGAPEFESMRVFDYLMALPKVGRVKANKTLVQTRISPSKTIGGLTERQRAELVAMLPGQRRTIG
jgi:hypothetical protein